MLGPLIINPVLPLRETDLHLLIGDSIFEIPITCQKQKVNQTHILGIRIHPATSIISFDFVSEEICQRVCNILWLVSLTGRMGWSCGNGNSYLCCQQRGGLRWSGGPEATSLNWLSQTPSALEKPGGATGEQEGNFMIYLHFSDDCFNGFKPVSLAFSLVLPVTWKKNTNTLPQYLKIIQQNWVGTVCFTINNLKRKNMKK